jgi:hypothetical protein
MPIAPKYTWTETAEDVTVVFEGVSLRASSAGRAGGGNNNGGAGLSLGGAGVGDPLVVSDRVVKLNLPPHFALLDLHGEVDETRAVASFAVVEKEEEEADGEGAGTAGGDAASAPATPAAPTTTTKKPVSRRPVLTLRLPKRNPGETWGRLLAHAPPGTEGAKQVAARRADSLERWRAARQAEAERRAERRRAAETQAADRALLFEERRREAAEARRGHALKEARAAVAGWRAAMAAAAEGAGVVGGGEADAAGRRQRQRLPSDQAPPPVKGDSHDDEEDLESDYDEDLEGLVAAGADDDEAPGAKPLSRASSPPPAVDSDWYHGRCRWRSSCSKAEGSDEEDEAVKRQGEEKAEAAAAAPPPPPPPPAPLAPLAPLAVPPGAPPVRGSDGAVFRVSFTETACGAMPLREGREAELVAAMQLRQQKKDKATTSDGDGGLAERSPAFLKDKGDALFRRGDSDGAVHAYTRALELLGGEEGTAALLSNRAAALLRLAEEAGSGGGEDAARRCVSDCDAAIAALEEQQQQQDEHGRPASVLLLSRARALARRGAAKALLTDGPSTTDAADDCAEAARLFAAAGEPGRAAALEAEAARLRAQRAA